MDKGYRNGRSRFVMQQEGNYGVVQRWERPRSTHQPFRGAHKRGAAQSPLTKQPPPLFLLLVPRAFSRRGNAWHQPFSLPLKRASDAN